MSTRPSAASHRFGRICLACMTVDALLLTVAPVTQARPNARTPAAPHNGGTITVRDDGAPDCLDPQQTAASTSGYVFSAVVDTLISDAKGKLRPDLALKWKVSKGGTVITFFLRRGVRFSNGDPFTAQDVKATFDRALNPATKSPLTASNLGTLKATRVIDPYTAQIVMKTPFRPIMTNLAFYWEGIIDVKAMTAEGSKVCQFPIGTGPFKVRAVGPGFSTVTLVRNPYHTWEPATAHNQGRPYLDKIVYQPITSDATAISALLSGSVDLSDVPGPQLNRVRNNSSVTLHKSYVQGENYLGFNTGHAPFDKVEVRKGIAEAIDRSAIVKAAISGLGKPVASVIPFTLPFYDKHANSYAPRYNPADARRILQADHVTGPYTLLTFNNPTNVATAELVQAELAQVGVKVNIVSKDVPGYIQLASKGNFDLNILGWGWNDPDFLYTLFHSSQETGGGINFTFYKSKTLDTLLVKGRETVNQKKAAGYYKQLQRFMAANVIVDPLWVDLFVNGTRTRLKGWHTDFTGINPIWEDLYVG